LIKPESGDTSNSIYPVQRYHNLAYRRTTQPLWRLVNLGAPKVSITMDLSLNHPK